MRRALATTLLLAAALSTAAALPPPPFPAPCTHAAAGHAVLTECQLLKKLFCNKANRMAALNQLNTWKTFDDYDYSKYVVRTQGVRFDDSLEDTRTWMYPSQFGRLQRGFESQTFDHYSSGDYSTNNFPHHEQSARPNINILIRRKDVLVDNDKTYDLYHLDLATTDPFYLLTARFLCRTDEAESDSDSQEDLNSQEADEMNAPLKDTVEKRDDVLDQGQKEIPMTLIFNDDKSDVEKKLFALWSRMQSLTPKGRQLPSRRHSFALYDRDALSADTRAARLRPPGQPLRWG